jgi:hypothetical protein
MFEHPRWGCWERGRDGGLTGRRYKIQPNIGGWTVKSATKLWVPPDLRWERGHGGLDGDGGWEWRMDMDEVFGTDMLTV